ncbi:hypothetical protein J4E83_010401 [Alternaria metachromatica]|uniref:uncharacterized protein n=1 Tax=Alternaria metachromatica TaxID=283354 RepID=UPI0020C34144|nr:uncharacterized protein J4E83_010401 [Alternaria metachromatica]KAI4605975.1 hypothetical protein J4E83_010401 [Alternaria metachromatica]
MDTSKTTTPPATPSRASIDPAPSTQRSSVSMHPPRMDNSDDFIELPHIPGLVDVNPSPMLMQTPITIECGPKLETKLTYHKEMICCHSKKLEAMFAKAKPIMVHYEKADKFRNDLARYVFPEVNAKEFEDQKMDRQAIPLIKEASENYPLLGYAGLVKKTIMDAVAGEMIAKNNRKTAQAPSADLSLAGRLLILKPQAVHEVAAKLFAVVHRINKSEIRKAEQDPLKAAAQHRIILPDVEESTVRALMQWIYQGPQPLEGSEQTYAVMKLAERLGVAALAIRFRDALCHVTNASIERADADGTSFQTLIGYGTAPAADDIVRVVFEHAMKDENAPEKLKGLIIDALAGYLDLELWQHVKGQINHKTALQIIESMVRLRPLVKTEMDGQDSIKSESQKISSVSTPEDMEVDEDKKPIHVKEQNENHV